MISSSESSSPLRLRSIRLPRGWPRRIMPDGGEPPTSPGRRQRGRRARHSSIGRPGRRLPGRLAAEPGVHGRADVGELALLVDPARGVPPGGVREQQRVLARVVGRLRRRVAAVIRRDDEQVAGSRASRGCPGAAGRSPGGSGGSSPGRCGGPRACPSRRGSRRRGPASTFSSSSIVRLIPSTFDFVGNESSTSQPAKMSEIFPTPYTVLPASRISER